MKTYLDHPPRKLQSEGYSGWANRNTAGEGPFIHQANIFNEGNFLRRAANAVCSSIERNTSIQKFFASDG